MDDPAFPVDAFFDATNEIIQAVNSGNREVATRLLHDMNQSYRDRCPFPDPTHPAIHALSQCLASCGLTSQYQEFLSAAAFYPERDRTIRQNVNDVCAMFGQTADAAVLGEALSRCIGTCTHDDVIYPHMDDVFKALRSLTIVLGRNELQLPIDKARYYSSCVATRDVFDGREDGIVEVSGIGFPDFKLLSHGDCPISAVIDKHGVYEPTSTQIWASLAATSPLTVDVGAHVGYYALLAASVNPDAPVHAMEPHPDAFARLKENVELNTFNNVTCHACAVARESATVEFQYLSTSSKSLISTVGSTTGRTWGQGESLTVSAQSLDGLVSRDIPEGIGSGRPLVKIDTEGKEGDVLEGAVGLIESSWPDLVVESFNTQACEQINAVLGPASYRFFRVIEGGHKLVQMQSMEPAYLSSFEDFNTLATRRSVDELKAAISSPISIETLS